MDGPAGGDVGRTAILGTSEVGRVRLRRVAASGASAAAGPLIASRLELDVFYFLYKFRVNPITFEGVMRDSLPLTFPIFEQNLNLAQNMENLTAVPNGFF